MSMVWSISDVAKYTTTVLTYTFLITLYNCLIKITARDNLAVAGYRHSVFTKFCALALRSPVNEFISYNFMNMYLDTSLCRRVFRAVRRHYFIFLLTGWMCRQLVLFSPKLSFIYRLQLLNTVEAQREESAAVNRCRLSMKYDAWDAVNATLHIAAWFSIVQQVWF